jgi:hypothetical protein
VSCARLQQKPIVGSSGEMTDLLHGDGGGFGVGSEVDMTATGRAEWQFARHFGIAMG